MSTYSQASKSTGVYERKRQYKSIWLCNSSQTLAKVYQKKMYERIDAAHESKKRRSRANKPPADSLELDSGSNAVSKLQAPSLSKNYKILLCCICALSLIAIVISGGLAIAFGIVVGFINSKNSSNGEATTASTTTLITATTTTTTTISLPNQCYNYTTFIPDATRYYNYTGPGNCSGLVSPQDCTTVYPNGWYRIQSSSYGTTITTTAPTSLCRCGANYPGWWNGILPATSGQTTSASLCYWASSAVPCWFSLPGTSATNCNGYYVYYLGLFISCSNNMRFCTTF